MVPGLKKVFLCQTELCVLPEAENFVHKNCY